MKNIVNVVMDKVNFFFMDFSLRNKFSFVDILSYSITIPINILIQPYHH